MSFNIHFDASFLDEAERKTGIELYFKRYPICLRAIAWDRLDHRNPFDRWSMKEVCEKLGIPPEPAIHRAMHGVEAEFEIYKKICQIKEESKLFFKEGIEHLIDEGFYVVP